ncbi:MAG: acetyl/propionyl/methylcrotonyl-CoA carboxylase subunit alpha [Acidobacteriota bacterium]
MDKVLVANRGEIAVRIMRACREMRIATVGVYSECDRDAYHVRYADEAHPIGPSPSRDSYLRIDKLIEVAKTSGADAVHPGYGFLAENEEFSAACRENGMAFIGPSPEAITLMGSKTAARQAALKAGVPVVPGTESALPEEISLDDVAHIADEIGYPVLIKAVAGGGGKGMRVASMPADLPSAVRAARSEALSSFGDGSIYIERRLLHPRHIEIQLLADHHGTVVPFVERECSIQRRQQKVVEESPSPAVSTLMRENMASRAAALAREVGYTNAGTMEFLVEGGEFFFLEMNTRLQVEHPVTEMITGLDLVQWQIRIAQGEKLTIDPARALTPRGHAIECRIYAEDPDNAFRPSPGLITSFRLPSGPGIRNDAGVTGGSTVPIFYDSLIAKLIGWGEDRSQALARLSRALQEYQVLGIRTTIPFFQWLIRQPAFVDGQFDTTFLDRVLLHPEGSFVQLSAEGEDIATIAAALHTLLRASRQRAGTASGASAAVSPWKIAARKEALRP